jgi:hypothetical protein
VNASILDFYSLFDNLIKNAKESSSGEVTIIFKTWQEGSVICVAISDTGSGIAPEDLPFIFDQYWTKGKVGGIGLGLAIVKETVERYGGTISVESQVGVGTTFTVRLPVAGAASAGTNANMTGEPAEAVTARQAAMLKAIDAAQQNGSSGAFLNEIKVSVEIIKQTRRAFAIVVGRKELANQLQSCGFEAVIYKATDSEIPIAIEELKDEHSFDKGDDFVLIVAGSEIRNNLSDLKLPLQADTDVYRAINDYIADV